MIHKYGSENKQSNQLRILKSKEDSPLLELQNGQSQKPKVIDESPILNTIKDSNWIIDTTSGYKFYNSSPQNNQVVEFSGNYKNDNASGTLTWYTNGKYSQTTEGYWEKGLLQGQAKLSFSNGDEINGLYKNNKRNGRVFVKYADGRVFDNIWEDGKLIQDTQNLK